MKPELDELPSRESNRFRNILHARDRNSDVPWNRIKRWLRSKVGESFNSVLSQWVRLEWLPVRLRNYAEFRYHVEVNVIIGDDQKLYYANCFMSRYFPIDGDGKVIYVSPLDNKIAVSKHLGKKRDWKKERQEELSKRFIRISDHHHYCKIDGIWYEVVLRDHYFQMRYDPLKKECYQVWRNVEKNTPLPDIADYRLSRLIVLKREQLSNKKLKELGVKND